MKSGAKMLDDFSNNALLKLYLRVKAMGPRAMSDFFLDLIKSGYVTQEKMVEISAYAKGSDNQDALFEKSA